MALTATGSHSLPCRRFATQRLVNAKGAAVTLSKYVRFKVSFYAGFGTILYIRQVKRGVSIIEASNIKLLPAANAKNVVKEAVSLRGRWDTEGARRSASEAGPDYRERILEALCETSVKR